MNNYILEYYQAIQDGTEIVSRWIKLWYEYIVKGLEEKRFFFDQKKANKAIRFIENFCHHHEGALAPGLIKLELWQKADFSVIFGIVDKDGYRQFREVFNVMGRKNGKTLGAAAISNFMTFVDNEYGARIYFCAPKLEQAKLCYDAYYQMILKEQDLSNLAKKRRTDIYIASTNTSAQPLAFNAKKSDGLSIHLCVADEIAAWQGDQGIKQYEVLKSSMGARRQPMIYAITTANYGEGIYDELMKRSTSLLLGTSKETRLAPFIRQIDDVTKWNDINELRKSMPNLGISVSVNYMLEEIAIAENSLPRKAEFLCKYCCIKSNSSVAWLDAITIENCSCEPLNLDDFRECYCTMGIDLSRTTDMTCAVVCIEKEGTIYVFAKFFMPTNKIDEMTSREGVPYRAYIQRGFLKASGENFVDYHDVEDFIRELIVDKHIFPLKLGYDRYSASYLIQSLTQSGVNCDDVYQGFNLTPVITECEGMMKDGKIKIGDNDLLKMHLYNSALKRDENDRTKLVKIEQRQHIDGTAAFLDAMCVRQKWWAEVGTQLRNGRS